MSMRRPSPPAVFFGRDSDLQRLERALQRVPLAVVSGVGGVGKTALALKAAAAWSGPVVYRRLAGAGESAGPLLDALRRELAGGTAPPMQTDEDRAADLALRLEQGGALCLLDDLHRLVGEDPRVFLERLVPLLSAGRVLVTTRQRIVLGARGPDRVEVPLEGLDAEGARSLWAVLDELQGPGPDFDRTWRRTGGLPLLLRRAHQGSGSDDEDPIAETVAALQPAELRAAAALALSDIPLPRAVLERVPEVTSANVQALTSRLVVTLDREGFAQVHDLFREALLARLTPSEAQVLHRWLADLLDGLEGLEEVTRLREAVRHLLAAGETQRAAEVLVRHSDAFIRRGATAELLSSLDAIPAEARSVPILLLRSRARARLLDVYGAYEEVSPLMASGEFPPADVRLVVAQLAMLRGELGQAAFILRFLLEDPALTVSQRMRVFTHLSLTLTHQGEGEEARRLLEVEAAHTVDPVRRGYLALARAFSFWLEEDPRAEEWIRTAIAALREAPPSYRAGVLTSAAQLAAMALTGRTTEADEALAKATTGLARGQDLRTRMMIQYSAALLHAVKGERLAALELLRSTIAMEERGGATVDWVFAMPLLARVLGMLGRTQEAQEVLLKATAAARSSGMENSLRVLEKVRAELPLAQLEAGVPLAERPMPVSATYAAALRALHRTQHGDPVDPHASPPRLGDDSPLEQLLWGLASGRPAAELAEAAARGKVDPSLIQQLLASVQREELASVTVDARSHRLLLPHKEHPLVRRPVLRRLLYALSQRPGEVVTKEQLAVEIWGREYDPRLHDNALRLNVKQLRALFADSDLALEFDDVGYRMKVPAGFKFVPDG